MLAVTRFINSYKEANSFVVEINEHDVIIIDLGSNYSRDLKPWLLLNKKKTVGVILTHEHADHCCGVNEFLADFETEIYCSEKCAENIQTATQNFSRYTDEIETFIISKTPRMLKEGSPLFFSEIKFEILETPGHSPGGICIYHDNQIFTGDTLLKNHKTPLGFPHSDKVIYAQSLEKVLLFLNENSIIYPGHGLPYKAPEFLDSLVK